MNALLEFCDAMRQAGLVPPEVIEADGALHRFHVAGDRAGFAQRLVLPCTSMAAPRASSAAGKRAVHRPGRRTARASRPPSATPSPGRSQRSGARQTPNGGANTKPGARRAALLWGKKSDAADPHHPYLVAKHVKAHALRQSGAALIVPLFDAFRQFWNVQRILPNGGKWFRKARAGGLYSPIGDLTNPTQILLCEGWATGATLHEASGHPVLCAHERRQPPARGEGGAHDLDRGGSRDLCRQRLEDRGQPRPDGGHRRSESHRRSPRRAALSRRDPRFGFQRSDEPAEDDAMNDERLQASVMPEVATVTEWLARAVAPGEDEAQPEAMARGARAGAPLLSGV
jgi:putative DNA primase/helicase